MADKESRDRADAPRRGRGPVDPPEPAGADAPPAHPEYRAEELAAKAGITTRTLRFYRERRLLPPPRRQGRIAWYDDRHLSRLRTITTLLERGHTLGGIADLIGAFEEGRDSRGAAQLLGLEPTVDVPFSEETEVRLSPETLAEYYEDSVTPENLTAALEIGYISVDGEEFVHVSRRLLEASAALVREGLPLGAVLDAGREVRAHADAIADALTRVTREHLLPPQLTPENAEAVAESLERLRPLAKQVLEAEVSLALDRRVRGELDRLGASPPDPPHEPD
ncbi:MerR family transcriptional regulator [Streptomyces sp. NPDC005438]|uniref:MerR family transcriptional regulator n=1 Tax=Streptomyces sp. NPDC005438 TaxID=3156880 RepID=UPI0033B3004E